MTMTGIPPSPDFLKIGKQGVIIDEYFHIYFSQQQNCYGMHVLKTHLNTLDIMHGGLMAAVCDAVLGHAAVRYAQEGTVTLSLSMDFLQAARLGDWIRIEIRITRKTRRILFCDGIVSNGDQPLVRTNATFYLSGKPPPPESL